MKSFRTLFYSLTFAFISSALSFSRNIEINQVTVFNAPNWLDTSQVQSVVDKIQETLEWDLRKVAVFYFSSSKQFNTQHQFKFPIDAFFKKSSQSIYLSPQVTPKNFKKIFSHELVHAIFYQKYRNAIPVWLEEGLANKLSGYPTPNYSWLTSQSWPSVTTLGHVNDRQASSRTYYSVSTGLIEMIQEKCNLKDLLKLTVGSKLTHYLKTFCGITDIDQDFRTWVKEKAQNKSVSESQTLPWWKQKSKPQWWKKE